jgi:hypothetical protein
MVGNFHRNTVESGGWGDFSNELRESGVLPKSLSRGNPFGLDSSFLNVNMRCKAKPKGPLDFSICPSLRKLLIKWGFCRTFLTHNL